MARCIIIAPLYRGEESAWLRRRPGDLILCADGGYDAAVQYGIVPDLVIGDFDSMPREHVQGCETVILPVHKDDTDTVVCFREGRARGYREFILAGATGGRFDHTMANLQCLHDCAVRGEEAWMCDKQNRIRVLLPGEYTLTPPEGCYLSLLSFTPECRGITLRGVEWELTDAVIDNRYPIGCSNWVKEREVSLAFTEGALLLIYSCNAVG